MTDVRVPLPKPEVSGVGSIRYRCADCGELMDPADAVVLDNFSYHRTHLSDEMWKALSESHKYPHLYPPQEPPNGR